MSHQDNGDEPLDSRALNRKEPDRGDEGRSDLDPTIFNLSGGIMREERAKTNGSIDDLLLKLMSQPSGRRISKSVDRNLDYLHTCLQLDMIRMIAEGIEQPPTEKDEDDLARDRIIRSLRGSVDYLNPPSDLE